MRTLHVTCDQCGTPKSPDAASWWVLEQDIAVLTTGPIDLCSLWCVLLWVFKVRRLWRDQPEGRERQAYPADFHAFVKREDRVA